MLYIVVMVKSNRQDRVVKRIGLLIIPFLFLVGSCDLFIGDDSSPYVYDMDGIPDEYELPGTTYLGLPLYDWGARPQVTDLFIHVSTMDYSGTDSGMLLQKDALDNVVSVFAENNIAIHFDVGTTGLYNGTTAVDPGEYNLSGEDHTVPYALSIFLDDRYGNAATVEEYENTYFPSERLNIFYYLVVGSSQNLDGSDGSSGVSWCPGRQFLITLANWGLNCDSTSMTNLTVNFQAGTIMHEFGHNLGLLHGGFENANYKPNYYSIMNYLYQLYGLPVIGNNEGDRYYFEQYNNSSAGDNWQTNYSAYASLTSLVYNPYTTDFTIDYSHGNGGDLNETSLAEASGLLQSGSGYVDWDGDKTITNGVSTDINYTDTKNKLSDYNDWDNLYYYFYYLNEASSGRSYVLPNQELMVEEIPAFIKNKQLFKD